MVGGFVLTQNDVQDTPEYGLRSIGMGSYNFDAHYSNRGYAKTQINSNYIAPSRSRPLVHLHRPLLYHTIQYHTIPYHTIPYHTIPYHTIPYHPPFSEYDVADIWI